MGEAYARLLQRSPLISFNRSTRPTPLTFLDLQSGPGVDLHDQRSELLVDHQIRAKVTKAGGFATGG